MGFLWFVLKTEARRLVRRIRSYLLLYKLGVRGPRSAWRSWRNEYARQRVGREVRDIARLRAIRDRGRS